MTVSTISSTFIHSSLPSAAGFPGSSASNSVPYVEPQLPPCLSTAMKSQALFDAMSAAVKAKGAELVKMGGTGHVWARRGGTRHNLGQYFSIWYWQRLTERNEAETQWLAVWSRFYFPPFGDDVSSWLALERVGTTLPAHIADIAQTIEALGFSLKLLSASPLDAAGTTKHNI